MYRPREGRELAIPAAMRHPSRQRLSGCRTGSSRGVSVRALRAWRALLEDDAPAVFRRMSKWGQLVTPA